MASNIPAGLKPADIGRFALRAAQLESAKPIISYWCEFARFNENGVLGLTRASFPTPGHFWIVNQIIEKGLHNSDDEVKLYTVNLMEKLEQFKIENPDNDAILDSVAASAYVEQFGLEVFGRAEATMRANKVTKQTADTFQAAATFLELCQIWNPLDPEIAAKVKFAKYHALRIVKAIKAGEDPNESNPVIQEEEEEALPEEQELQHGQIEGQVAGVDGLRAHALQPTVEEVPDESQPTQYSTSSPTLPQPPTASTELPSAPDSIPTTSHQHMDVDEDSPLSLPSAPETLASRSMGAEGPVLPDTPTKIGTHDHAAPSNTFQSFPPPSGITPVGPPAPHDVSSFYHTPSTGEPSRIAPPAGPGRVPPVQQPAPISTAAQVNSHGVDDEAIALAQKHARWAVSALAFDDVHTAIKELRNSLRYLGAE
ncbi:hypothetical protein AOCH_005230 [Aspergillus ochraceoroseus]|uniref:Vta1 C-terminal domain-containing protein n=1 Tax=Aspergillus ochraceoroseus TaxID=138278 RepID=A0A0F8WQJ4_9EURO|nr:hypothetical protein AOCH_005230 [Aspergillus ochraceoroseus]